MTTRMAVSLALFVCGLLALVVGLTSSRSDVFELAAVRSVIASMMNALQARGRLGGTRMDTERSRHRPFGRAASIASLRGDFDRLLDLNLTLHGVLVRPDPARLQAMIPLIESGQLRAVIDRVLPLEQAATAHRRLDSGHGRGKIVLQVRP